MKERESAEKNANNMGARSVTPSTESRSRKKRNNTQKKGVGANNNNKLIRSFFIDVTGSPSIARTESLPLVDNDENVSV